MYHLGDGRDLMAETDRREEIMDAVERLLARAGAGAVTMRAVAAEARVSLRLVQYYGNTKDELLEATLVRHAQQSIDRWRERSGEVVTDSPIEIIAAFLDEALPTDRKSRDFHRIGVSMEEMAIADPDLAGRAYRKHLSGLADHLTEVLESGASSTTAGRSLALEVMALAHGVGTLVMAGQLSTADAQALIRNYLGRLGPHLSS